MAIGLDEHVVSLADAAEMLPRRKGRKIALATLYRWTQKGCRGVSLESVQIGARRCTSREALERFFRLLTHEIGRPETPRPHRAAEVERALDQAGI